MTTTATAKPARVNHLKAALDPAAYLCITPLYLGSVSSDEQGDAVDSLLGDMFDLFAEANKLAPYSAPLGNAEVRALHAERGIADGRFAKKGTCDHCGAAFKFGYIFEHVTTKQVIVVGRTCGQDFAVGSKALLAMTRLEKGLKVAAESAKRAKVRAAFLALHDGLAEALKGTHSIVADINNKLTQYGSISAGQVALVHKLNAQQAEKAARNAEVAAVSNYVGTVGERITLELTAQFFTSFDGMFGTTYVNRFVDAAGNVVIHKGSVDMRYMGYDAAGNFVASVCPGDKVTVTGTVKAHAEYNGIKQTLLSRPKTK